MSNANATVSEVNWIPAIKFLRRDKNWRSGNGGENKKRPQDELVAEGNYNI